MLFRSERKMKPSTAASGLLTVDAEFLHFQPLSLAFDYKYLGYLFINQAITCELEKYSA